MIEDDEKDVTLKADIYNKYQEISQKSETAISELVQEGLTFWFPILSSGKKDRAIILEDDIFEMLNMISRLSKVSLSEVVHGSFLYGFNLFRLLIRKYQEGLPSDEEQPIKVEGLDKLGTELKDLINLTNRKLHDFIPILRMLIL